MPPQPLLDLSRIDPSNVLVSKEEIYQVNPHRHEFALLDGICHIDLEEMTMAAFVDVRDDQFWVRGHIPGRPLFPGVLMIESAAQMVGYFVKEATGFEGFVGFGGVGDVKFRGQVVPGDRLILLGRQAELRGRRRITGITQGFVDGQMVYEGTIHGAMI